MEDIQVASKKKKKPWYIQLLPSFPLFLQSPDMLPSITATSIGRNEAEPPITRQNNHYRTRTMPCNLRPLKHAQNTLEMMCSPSHHFLVFISLLNSQDTPIHNPNIYIHIPALKAIGGLASLVEQNITMFLSAQASLATLSPQSLAAWAICNAAVSIRLARAERLWSRWVPEGRLSWAIISSTAM